MNIVITAGGTSEYIDKVRKITNSGTGKLGAMITNALSKLNNVKMIYYICTPKAIKPDVEMLKLNNINVEIIEVVNTNDVKNAVEKTLRDNVIDWFIHSMAISDYCVDYITSVDNIITDLSDNQIDLEKYFERPNHVINNKTKISSNQKDLIIKLKQAPKIISLIKNISPKTNLIGFKLLDNVTNEYLIEIAQNLAKKNNCDYVIANDMKYIKNGEHKAFVVTKERVIGEEIIGKENIVKKIIELIK